MRVDELAEGQVQIPQTKGAELHTKNTPIHVSGARFWSQVATRFHRNPYSLIKEENKPKYSINGVHYRLLRLRDAHSSTRL
jgi:hypothetical protein